MKKYTCVNCGESCYSSAEIKDMTDPKCPTCRGKLKENALDFPPCATMFRESGKLKTFYNRGYLCIVLEHSGETALILRPFSEENHYIIAQGYNHKTGTWRSSQYCDDLNEARLGYLRECQKPMELSL